MHEELGLSSVVVARSLSTWGSWAACRPVVLRGDESTRTEDVWFLEPSISAQTIQTISPSSRRDIHARVIHVKSYSSTSMTRDGMKRATRA